MRRRTVLTALIAASPPRGLIRASVSVALDPLAGLGLMLAACPGTIVFGWPDFEPRATESCSRIADTAAIIGGLPQ